MLNRQMRSTKLAKVLALLLLAFALSVGGSYAESSYRDTQTIINKTDKTLLVTFFRGYPINVAENKVLKPGEKLRIDELVSRPADIYLLTAVDLGSLNKKVIYQRCVDMLGLMKLYELDQEKNGIPIRNDDLVL
jgi:hypothetical protein